MKAIYDQYAQNNQLVNFKGHSHHKDGIDELEAEHKTSDLLYEFAEKFKEHTS